MRHLLALLLALAALFPSHAVAELLIYHAYSATMSLTVVSRELDAKGKNALVTRRYTNKQITNLAQGRAPELAVPKNEVIVALIPDDYRKSDQIRIVLIDRNTSSVLTTIMTSGNSHVGFGPPAGFAFKGIQTITIAAMGSAAGAIGQVSATASFEGIEKTTPTGPNMSIKVVSVTAPVDFTINSVMTPAILTGASIRIAGKNLLDLYADF